jgi:hypothetical protein
METVMLGVETARRLALKIGPYVAVELLLPGGTLLALALYWYRRRAGANKFVQQGVDLTPLRSTMV